jgi:hypothetical protein
MNKHDKTTRLQLEQQFYLSTKKNNTIKMLFGHLHHAGGTAVCQLARNNLKTNLKSNCNHPLEFSQKETPPTRGTLTEQLQFASKTSWDFYAVELSMPQELTYSGPLIYSIVIRHPYLLLLSQYRRARVKFQFNGTLQDLIAYQFQRVHSSFNHSKIPVVKARDGTMAKGRSVERQKRGERKAVVNYYRGIAGFILGKYSETSQSSESIYQETIRRLEHFSVILLTEEMSLTAQLFYLKFNWNITESYGQSLVNSHGTGGELLSLARSLNSHDREFIRWYGEIDLMVYSYCRCRLEREFKEILKQRGSEGLVEAKKFKFPDFSVELKKLEKIISGEEKSED